MSTSNGLLINASFGDRLRGGITAAEAVRRATNWWELKGRTFFRQRMLSGNPGALAFSKNPDHPNFIPSPIQLGLPWDDLDRDSKLRVVKAWHEEWLRQEGIEQ